MGHLPIWKHKLYSRILNKLHYPEKITMNTPLRMSLLITLSMMLFAMGCAKKTVPDNAMLDECNTKLASTEAELAELRKKQETTEANMLIYRTMLERRQSLDKELREKLKGMIDAGQVRITSRRGLLLLELPQEVLFDSGKAELKADAKTLLAELAQVLSPIKDCRLLVAGHTDSDPIKARKSTYASNWQLSTARAQSVVNLMVENTVAPSNIGVAGFGEYDPAASNDDPEGKALNRRIEIMLIPDLEELMNMEKQLANMVK